MGILMESQYMLVQKATPNIKELLCDYTYQIEYRIYYLIPVEFLDYLSAKFFGFKSFELKCGSEQAIFTK